MLPNWSAKKSPPCLGTFRAMYRSILTVAMRMSASLASAFGDVMVGLLVCDSATLTRMPKGHTHNGADGFIAFIGRILRGFIRMGARVAGRSCNTVQSFVREIIPSAYRGTNGTGRLRSVNFLAATFQWKTFLEPYLDDELGGITSGLHIKPSLKQSVVDYM